MRLTFAALAFATALAGIGAAQAAPVGPKAGIAAPTHVVAARMTRKRHVMRHKMHRRAKHVGAHRLNTKVGRKA